LHQRNGSKYTRDGFNSAWAKARATAAVAHPELQFDFTFHDIRAKGIADLNGTLPEKQDIQDTRRLRKQRVMIAKLRGCQ